MASLYDLELQESNNFIHLFLTDGASPSLKLLREQKEMAGSMGEVGEKIIHDLDDPKSDLGKSYKRLEDLERDVQEVMKQISLTKELADKANTIFSHNPASLDDLDDADRSAVQDYWIKKKMCIAELTKRGYTYQELYS